MRIRLLFLVILSSALLGPSVLAAKAPPLRLSDPNLPLQELRPLDRHVWVLGLEGEWKQPALLGVGYHVNLIFPNGQSYSHRVLDDATFRVGEVRCLIPDYQLLRNGLASGGKFTIVVSARRSVTTAKATEVVSAPFEVRWPLDRPILRWAAPTRFTPRPPIDAFPPPRPDRIPRGEPPPVPD